MRSLVEPLPDPPPPEALAAAVADAQPVLLHSGRTDGPWGRHSFLAARPFLTFRSFGSRCEIATAVDARTTYGNPWRILAELLGRLELPDEADLPFPLGGCFGFWGYDLKNFVEPKLPRRAPEDLDLPDCHLGFHDSLVAWDHHLDGAWLVSTGLLPDGSRSLEHSRRQAEWWRARMLEAGTPAGVLPDQHPATRIQHPASTLSRADFLAAVARAQRYIRAGAIYQVNLSHRLTAPFAGRGWEFFLKLAEVSPAPFAAFVEGGDFQIASSSPELFLRLSGRHATTRPIKGTRPRDADPARDARLAYELQTSAKEAAELVMITDLLRNDLGRVCEFGSVQAPDLLRLERFAQVQHLVSTVEGRLRAGVTHLDALAACFPGGSVTGAPKFRAMEVIDELEPVARGPYCGALGCLGFNRESQLSIVIRAAILKDGAAHFPVGAGIVADSVPEAEYEETLAKAEGLLAVLRGLRASAGVAARPRPSRRLGVP